MFAVEVPHERQTWRMEAELATNSAVFLDKGNQEREIGREDFISLVSCAWVYGGVYNLKVGGFSFFFPLIFEYNFSRKAQIDWHRYRIDWPGDSESVFEPSSTGYVSNTENPNLHEHTKWAFILSIDFNDWLRTLKVGLIPRIEWVPLWDKIMLKSAKLGHLDWGAPQVLEISVKNYRILPGPRVQRKKKSCITSRRTIEIIKILATGQQQHSHTWSLSPWGMGPGSFQDHLGAESCETLRNIAKHCEPLR